MCTSPHITYASNVSRRGGRSCSWRASLHMAPALSDTHTRTSTVKVQSETHAHSKLLSSACEWLGLMNEAWLSKHFTKSWHCFIMRLCLCVHVCHCVVQLSIMTQHTETKTPFCCSHKYSQITQTPVYLETSSADVSLTGGLRFFNPHDHLIRTKQTYLFMVTKHSWKLCRKAEYDLKLV